MINEILSMIESADSIIVSRHKNPDFDAYGSQFGLYYALQEKYPNKKIYKIGDSNQLNQFGDFDDLNETEIANSLLIVLDTVARSMYGNEVDKIAKQVILIDHHRNDPDMKYDLYYCDYFASSTAEMVTDLLQQWAFPISLKTAIPLYIGIAGDTGRFLYNNTTPKTLRIAADLLEKGIDINAISQSMYIETYALKKVKADFANSVQLTEKNVAYRKNDRAFLKKHNMDTFSVSRGLVSQMSGIKEIPIWANFTVDLDTNKVVCELRSRDIPVLDVAKKYGGGGHLFACGCTVDSFEEADLVLEDLNRLLEE